MMCDCLFRYPRLVAYCVNGVGSIPGFEKFRPPGFSEVHGAKFAFFGFGLVAPDRIGGGWICFFHAVV